MEFKSLDFKSSEPYYFQISNIIEQKIRNREIPIGSSTKRLDN